MLGEGPFHIGNEPDSADETPRWLLPSAVLWLVVATWLYTPYSARPYDILDFANFLPILNASTSVLDGTVDLTRFYAENHGRFNAGAFALLSLKWRLFGENMLGWQLYRFGEMCLLSFLLFMFLRRLRVSHAGAFASTVIMLASPSASANWMIMSVAEPPGTAALLILMLLFVYGSDTEPSRLTLVMIGVLTVLIGLLKEMLLAAVIVPAIVLTLRTRNPSQSGFRTMLYSRKLRMVCISGVLVAIPIIWFALDAPVTSYSRKFGAQTTPFNALMPAFAILVPFAPDESGGIPMLLGLSVYVIVVITGLGWLLGKNQRTRESALLVALGLGLAFSGVVAYSPWPSFSLIYALPFQVGTAVLVGAAITSVGKRTRKVAPALVVACGMLLTALMAASAQEYARFRTVSLKMSRDLANYIGTLDTGRDVHFEVCGPSEKLWQNYGLLINRYATSLGLVHPPIVDAPCHVSSPPGGNAQTSRHVILSNEPLRVVSGAGSLSYAYWSMDWSAFSRRRNELRLTMLNMPTP